VDETNSPTTTSREKEEGGKIGFQHPGHGGPTQIAKPADGRPGMDTASLFRFLKKMTLKKTPEELTRHEARKCIEGFKKMRDRTVNGN